MSAGVPELLQAIGYAGGCVYVLNLLNRTVGTWLVRRKFRRLVAAGDGYRPPEMRFAGSGGPPPAGPLHMHTHQIVCVDCGLTSKSYFPNSMPCKPPIQAHSADS